MSAGLELLWASKGTYSKDPLYRRVGSAGLSTGLKRGRWGGLSRLGFSTRVLGGLWSISRAWSCRNEVRLGEEETPDDPNAQRTETNVKILV